MINSYNSGGSTFAWHETTKAFCNGEQITLQWWIPTTINLFDPDYLFRADGGRIAQLSTTTATSAADYVYATGNRWNFMGDDLLSSNHTSSAVRRLTGFQNFDGPIRTVFGTFTEDQTATTLHINPVILWEGDDNNGAHSRLRFIFEQGSGGTPSDNELATLTGYGNFGINMIQPTSKLSLNGGIYLGNSSSSSTLVPAGSMLGAGSIYLGSDSYFSSLGCSTCVIPTNTNSIVANGGVYLGTSSYLAGVGNSAYLVTYPGTTAGFGIAAPNAYLHLNGLIEESQPHDFKITKVGSGGGTGSDADDGFDINVSYNGIVDLRNWEDNDIRFYTNSSVSTPNERMRITSGGDLLPGSDNAYNFGNSSYHWKEIFCTNNIINTSDINFKKDIQNLDYGLKEILKLKPISFHWKDNDNGKRLGFIAQDVEKVISEVVVVSTDTLGNTRLGMRYSEIIPILVKSIQEQQQIINSQNFQIDSLTALYFAFGKRLSALENKNNSMEQVEIGHLFQNVPNPFQNSTTIKYHLPANITSASIIIYDQNGNIFINQDLIPVSGESYINIDLTGMFRGVYVYKLYVNGFFVDIKKMLLTN